MDANPTNESALGAGTNRPGRENVIPTSVNYEAGRGAVQASGKIDADTLRTEIPAQMQEARRWLVWREVPDQDPAKKPRKVPHYANGRTRGATDTPADLEQLVDMEGAIAALGGRPGHYAGPGFALGADGAGGHWQGIDLDHTDTRPELNALARELPGYREMSPSGTGVHAIGYGPDFQTLGSNASGIEAYSKGRFFTVTGDAIDGDLEDLAPFVLQVLVPKHGGPKASEAPGADVISAETYSDLRSALSIFDWDSRDVFGRQGMRLKALGSQGFALFVEACQLSLSDRYDPKYTTTQWKTFKPDHTGYQAIFAEAQSKGWLNPRRKQPAQDAVQEALGGDGDRPGAAPTGLLSRPEAEALLAWSWRTGATLPSADDSGIFLGPKNPQTGKASERLRVNVLPGTAKTAPWIKIAWGSGPDRFVEEVDRYIPRREELVDQENLRRMERSAKPQEDISSADLRSHAVAWLARVRGLAVSDEVGRALFERVGGNPDDPAPVPVWPTLAPEALTGLAGDVVRLATTNSEADPAAVLMTFLTAFGAACGRSSMVLVGDTAHHPRLFTALVGASSRARKGTSVTPIKRLIHSAEQALSPPAAQLSPLFPLKISDGPLSSGEGLIWAIRDESEDRDKHGDPVTAGVVDKRLLVTEGEFGGALRVAGREGSSLSAILRTGWDGSEIRPLVSGRSRGVVGASNPHLCIVGHVTEAELKKVLSDVDVFNGLANRFLWTCVRRGTPNPFPAPMPDHLVNDLAARIAGALMFAEREQCLELSGEAREVWAKIYPALTQDEPGAFGATIARAEAQTLRLALIFALLDCSGAIKPAHLRQAVAVWQYCRDSAAYLFGAMSTDKMVERVAKIITEAGAEGISQADLSKALNRHVKGDRLAAILAELQAAGRVTQTRVDTPGRPAVIWRARHG